MRPLGFGVFAWFACLVGCQQTDEIPEITYFTTELSRRKEYTQKKAPRLESMVDEIDVSFSENPVKAKGPHFPPPSGNQWYYTRDYSVSVTCPRHDVRIERWGVLELENGRWQHASFSVRDFAEAFSCPGGVLEPRQIYTFDQAQTVGFLPGKVRWYFVAVDDVGHRVRGDGLVESAATEDEATR